MDSKPTPGHPADTFDAQVRLQKLLHLKAKMEQLHAELEYVGLMLRLGARQPQSPALQAPEPNRPASR